MDANWFIEDFDYGLEMTNIESWDSRQREGMKQPAWKRTKLTNWWNFLSILSRKKLNEKFFWFVNFQSKAWTKSTWLSIWNIWRIKIIKFSGTSEEVSLNGKEATICFTRWFSNFLNKENLGRNKISQFFLPNKQTVLQNFCSKPFNFAYNQNFLDTDIFLEAVKWRRISTSIFVEILWSKSVTNNPQFCFGSFFKTFFLNYSSSTFGCFSW